MQVADKAEVSPIRTGLRDYLDLWLVLSEVLIEATRISGFLLASLRPCRTGRPATARATPVEKCSGY